MKPVICIAGPTASGKSAWAIDLAMSVDGEIINADSMQIYRELRILTARPSETEEAQVKHHLFGYVSAEEQYSVGRWRDDAIRAILDCLVRGKTPILVGGTGLYFKALTDGLANIADVSQEGYDRANKLLEQGFGALRQKAEEIDPEASAKVLGDDPHRLLRIVSVGLGTDKTLSEWRATTKPVIPKNYWQGAVLLPEREKLYERINTRYAAMLEQGGLSEAMALRKLNFSPQLTAMKAIGVPPLIEYLDEKISFEEAVLRAQRDTRRFAKRQFTWFRGQTKHWFAVKNTGHKEQFRQKISNFRV